MFRLTELLQIHIRFRMAPVYAKCVKWFARQRSIRAYEWLHAVAQCILPAALQNHRAHKTLPKISLISRKIDKRKTAVQDTIEQGGFFFD